MSTRSLRIYLGASSGFWTEASERTFWSGSRESQALRYGALVDPQFNLLSRSGPRFLLLWSVAVCPCGLFVCLNGKRRFDRAMNSFWCCLENGQQSTECVFFLSGEYACLCFALRRCCHGAERHLHHTDDFDARVEGWNRTAPMSSCGNRFESRAVGSSRNIGFLWLYSTQQWRRTFHHNDAFGSWTLNVSPFHFNTQSVSIDSSDAVGHSFKSVYVARVDADTASSINAKPDEGLHVLLAAGIADLDAHLQTNNLNTVILDLGTGTLVSSKGNVVISAADVPSVRVCRRCAESWNVARRLSPKHGRTGDKRGVR